IAKVRTTPRTPPVTALSVVLMTLLSRNCSMNGPTKEIHKNGGVEMTHTLSSPPKVPAVSGGNKPGLRYAPREATKRWNRMKGPGATPAGRRTADAWLWGRQHDCA